MSNLQKFNTTLEDFDKEVGKLKAVSDAYQKLQGLTASYDEISQQFDQNSKALENINKGIEKSISEIYNLVDKKTDQISKENKEFYKDLASTIKIQLDDNKSQIKQLIENERNQIKQIFGIEFAKNTKELRLVIKTETNNQTQLLLDNQKVIKISLWVICGLTLLLCALAVVKLWLN
jgi:ABC-type transporter Mla subunit MlaD